MGDRMEEEAEPAAIQAPSPKRSKRASSSPPSIIGNYRLHNKKAGSGGLGVVYPAEHIPTGHPVALKLGAVIEREDGPHDFSMTTFKAEWNTYAALSGKALPWAAEAYELGLVKLEQGTAPWLTLSLLGRSMHDLNHAGVVQPGLFAYARSMLAALEGMHSQGFVHNDIKPANFCVAADFDSKAAAARFNTALAAGSLDQLRAEEPPVVLIDFGFAFKFDPTTAGQRMEFVGTPDYASSAALMGMRPGPGGDLEALGFTLLELALGELPWEVTKYSNEYDNSQLREISCWNAASLREMEARRQAKWEALVEAGKAPAWLVEWLDYCQEIPVSMAPNYQYLRELINGEEEQAVARRVAQAKADSAMKAWGNWPEE